VSLRKLTRVAGSHLYSVWKSEQSQVLGELLMFKCSISIDLAIKIIFNLQANVAYSSDETQAIHGALVPSHLKHFQACSTEKKSGILPRML